MAVEDQHDVADAMTTEGYSFGRRILDAVTMFVVLYISLLLLIYVAYGESKITYERFQGDRLSGQVHVVQNAMEKPLRSGLPLRQFVGFNTLTDPILASDPTIGSLVVHDVAGAVVFKAGDKKIADELPPPSTVHAGADFRRSSAGHPDAVSVEKPADNEYDTLQHVDGHYRITIPLSNKFEQVGSLSITMSETVVTKRVKQSFETLFYASPGAALLFALAIAVFGPAMSRSRVPWAQLGFGLVFLAASVGVVMTLIALYSDGAQSKARALANSLGQRLNDVVAFSINIDEIQGLDRTFGEYLRLNPDISAATLTIDNEVVIHTDQNLIGTVWTRSEGHYVYVVDLTPKDSDRKVQVVVELPNDVVFRQIIRSVKNFAAMFIASAFLANLFFQLGGTVGRPVDDQQPQPACKPDAQHEWMLNYVKPVFFLGVLLEHLTYAFLPQFVQEATQGAGISANYASIPFVSFYLMFALTLIPAGYVAQRVGPKPLVYCGLLLAGSGMAALATYPDFWMIATARLVSGVGQGMLFIGVQSYLLAVAPSDKKTQAAGVIVFGFQGGMISGMAVGSLLVGYMGTQGVFQLAAVIGVLAAFYAMAAVPRVSVRLMNEAAAETRKDLWSNLGRAIKDAQFVKTMSTIGVPAKAVLTGVVTFGLPLLLAKSGYPQEDIGQIIMIYAIGVVCANKFVTIYVDSIGNSRTILFHGTLLGGAGLVLTAICGSFSPDVSAGYSVTVLLVIGIMMVGASHGFINAPVISHIANSRLSKQIGSSTTTATYRFLERIGHVAGPVIFGQLLIWTNFEWTAVAITGGAIALFGLIFIFSTDDTDQESEQDVSKESGNVIKSLQLKEVS